ncbi:MAG: 5'-nucleotidase C-terminal domain-containing protein, partial [Cyanobacteria bacterium P01_F01_bin.42]
AAAQAVDPTVKVSLKNGGGIRAAIGEVDADGNLLPPQANAASGKLDGQISQLDIDNALRFNNGLTLLTLTATGLKQILEHGVAATADGATPGQFPQVSGLDFSFDPTQQAIEFTRDAEGNVTGIATEGQRVQSLAITSETGFVTDVIVENGELVGDPNREIRIVTLDFLAGGGDGYPFPEFGDNPVDLVNAETPEQTGAATFADDGSEQDALAEFLRSNFPADDDATTPAFIDSETAPIEDTRIQNLAVDGATDTVLEAPLAQVFPVFTSTPDLEAENVGTMFYDGTNFDSNDEVNTTLTNGATALGNDAVFDNLVGFYEIIDGTGGIDTDGDGEADLQPGDAGYARAAITNRVDNFGIRAGSSGNPALNTSVDEFGNVILAGGTRYAPFVIAGGGPLGFQGFIDAEDAAAAAGGTFNGAAEFLEDVVAYFSFVGANPDGAEHLQSRGNNVFGFEDLPSNIFSDMDFNDAVFSFEFSID